MKYSRSLRCALLAAAILAGHQLASALPDSFTLDQRTVLINQSANGTGARSLSPAITATLDAEAARQPFALRVAGKAPADGWKLQINGAPYEVDPIVESDGSWYGIQGGRLTAGANEIKITSANGEPVAVTDLLAFSINFAEEEHFSSFVSVLRDQPPSDPNQDDYDVEHMDLALTLNTAAATIPSGVATLTARSLVANLTNCVLDFNDNGGAMTISSIDSGPATPTLSYTWNTTTEKVNITLPSPVAAGNTFTVRVNYSGTPVASLAYIRSTQNGVPLIYTNNQPYNARTWYPCKDLPRDKFTVAMHATVPTASYSGFPFSVVSNGTLTSITTSGPNSTYHWDETYPIASQYVSLAATNYQVASGTYTALDNVTTMPVAHHVYPTSYASESQELPRTIEVMEYFADTFGEYPFLNEKYVTATWGISFGVEHQTCTSMPNGNLNNPAYHRRNIHELAHMWFGVCTGTETFDHLWLSEGWASYVEALWQEHKNGVAAYKTQMASFRSSSSDSRPVISPSADDFGLSVTYYKGAWVVHMLRHVVGDANFFQATKNYLADANLRYKAVVTQDFEDHQEAVYGQQLDWFFDQWLLRSSRPAYSWSWASHQDGGTWYLDLSIEQTQVDSVYEMPVDIGVDFVGGGSTVVKVTNNLRTQSFSIPVAAEPSDATFDPDEWILCTKTELAASNPNPPTLLSVVGSGVSGTATISWTPSSTPGITAYRLYASADGLTGWTLLNGAISPAATSTVVTGLLPGQSRYFYLTAVVVAQSIPSDVYGLRLGTGAAEILLVDGYDRWVTQTGFSNGENHDFAADHGRAIAAHGNSFDTCANEAVGAGVNLGGHGAVIYALGDESTVDETFSSSEQTNVAAYLESGGALFVTGNEIGWDLGRTSQPAPDQLFYLTYLKAAYVADDSNDYSTTGTSGVGSCFDSHSFNFGNGGDAPYLPGFPDLITTAGGSTGALEYSAGNLAGIQYKGTFGSGSTPGALVYVAFAFETVYPESSRLQMMSDVLDYFGLSGGSSVRDWMLF